MTDQPPRQPALNVAAEPGSRLEQLLASYESLKAAAEEHAARFKACADAIKTEVAGQHAGVPDFRVSGGPGLPVLLLSWKRPWHFDVRRFKEEQPELYVHYAERKPRWELRAGQ